MVYRSAKELELEAIRVQAKSMQASGVSEAQIAKVRQEYKDKGGFSFNESQSTDYCEYDA